MLVVELEVPSRAIIIPAAENGSFHPLLSWVESMGLLWLNPWEENQCAQPLAQTIHLHSQTDSETFLLQEYEQILESYRNTILGAHRSNKHSEFSRKKNIDLPALSPATTKIGDMWIEKMRHIPS